MVNWQITQIKINKTLIKLRFAKINPHEKSTGSQFAKSNKRETLKKMTHENKSKRKFPSLKTYMNGFLWAVIVLDRVGSYMF